jgi:hypothetical protein
VPSVVFDVPKSSPQIDMNASWRSVRLHIKTPSIHLYLRPSKQVARCKPNLTTKVGDVHPQIILFRVAG